MYKRQATYRSDITGQSFQTIKKMIQNVQNYSIKKYSAFVLESGLSRNKDHYIRTLNYKNDMLNINYQKFMIDYNVRKQQVQDYDSAMKMCIRDRLVTTNITAVTIVLIDFLLPVLNAILASEKNSKSLVT